MQELGGVCVQDSRGGSLFKAGPDAIPSVAHLEPDSDINTDGGVGILDDGDDDSDGGSNSEDKFLEQIRQSSLQASLLPNSIGRGSSIDVSIGIVA